MPELGEEIQPAWANGAKVLVPGLTQELWNNTAVDISLGSYHGLICPGDQWDAHPPRLKKKRTTRK